MKNSASISVYISKFLTAEQSKQLDHLLEKGERVELSKDKDSRVKMRTVWRKEVKI